MSAREWKRGDVAELPIGGRAWFVGETEEEPRPWRNEFGMPRWGDTTARSHSPRPLVVIDPEDREQAERLSVRFHNEFQGERRVIEGGYVDAMQAALREFVDPKPRIEEPRATGSIVHDHDGEAWVRYARGEWSCLHSRPGKDVRTWGELVAQYGPIEVTS